MEKIEELLEKSTELSVKEWRNKLASVKGTHRIVTIPIIVKGAKNPNWVISIQRVINDNGTACKKNEETTTYKIINAPSREVH
jgi:hypothetical protein